MANVDPHEVEIQHNCLLKEGNLHYRYDAFGRLIETEHHSSLDPQKRTPLMSYRYDDQHQLCKIINHETGEKYRYAYDLFGRRIEKENLNTGDLTKFLWQGDHLLAEYQDDQLLMPDADVKPTDYCTYLYEMGSFAPLALLEGKGSHTTPYFYINDHLGTPQQVVNQTGQTVWVALYYAYGDIETELINEIYQPLRFQGHKFVRNKI